MENKNLKIRIVGEFTKVTVETAFEDLSFTATCGSDVYQFKNDERDFIVPGFYNLRIIDMQTIENNKKFITSFSFNYYCGGVHTFDLSVHHHGKIYKVEAFQKYISYPFDRNESHFFIGEEGEPCVKFTKHERNTRIYKKFKMYNPPKPKE